MATWTKEIWDKIHSKSPPGFRDLIDFRHEITPFEPRKLATGYSGTTISTVTFDEADTIDPAIFDPHPSTPKWELDFDVKDISQPSLSEDQVEQFRRAAEKAQLELTKTFGLPPSEAELAKDKADFYKQQETTGIF